MWEKWFRPAIVRQDQINALTRLHSIICSPLSVLISANKNANKRAKRLTTIARYFHVVRPPSAHISLVEPLGNVQSTGFLWSTEKKSHKWHDMRMCLSLCDTSYTFFCWYTTLENHGTTASVRILLWYWRHGKSWLPITCWIARSHAQLI